MKLYPIHTLSDLSDLPPARRAVALGLFDGVHIGHRAVISGTLDRGLTASVFTFSDGARAMPKGAPALLSPENKQTLLAQTGVQELINVDFDCVRTLSPREFVETVLRDALHTACVCCGENFRFGADGAGDAETLRALCAEQQIDLHVVKTVDCDGVPISSTRIRDAIAAGDLPLATRLLGHPFWLDEVVSKGRQLGRTLGFPTLNQYLPEDFVEPRFGVYLSAVEIDGRVHTGLTNIGRRPTVGSDAPLAETWVPDYDGDLYGQTVRTIPVRFVRPEQAFPSVEALQAQLQKDAEAARAMTAPTGTVRAVLFDFDDTLQDRPVAYRRYAERFVDRHFPELSADEKAARVTEMWVKNGDGHAYVGSGKYIPYPQYFEGLIASWGWSDPPPIDELIAECRTTLATETALFPDAADTLKRLRQKGLLIGTVTNGFSSMQSRKLDMSGLRPLLDLTVVSGDEGIHKPDPELFRRAAARLGVACEDCVYVGDHPYYDMQGAADAHMRRVFIDAYGRGFAPADVPVITRLSELLKVL